MRPPTWLTGNNRSHYGFALPVLTTLLSLPQTWALQVVAGSNCTTACLSTATTYGTNGSDITCHDNDYNSTVFGGAFKECVSCELESQTFDNQTSQTDLGWAFYNMRYALDWCLFDYPQSRNQTVPTTCMAACAPISDALQTNLLTPNASTTYDYCQDPDFLNSVGNCASCYEIIPNQLFLSNFLNTLEYACQNRPVPTIPFYIKPDDIFTDDPPSNWSNIPVPGSSSHGLTHGAKVALAISIPVAAFLILSLLFVWLFVRKSYSRPPKDRRTSYYNEKHISKASAGWNGDRPGSPRRAFQQSRHISGRESPRPVPYPLPLSPQKVAMPAPLRPQKSNSSIPFSKVFGSPMYDEHMPAPLRSQKSNQSIPFLQPTIYSPPSQPDPKKKSKSGPSLTTRAHRPTAPSGLVSWERIAIQNARIRATQGPSPSPVSPLTTVSIVRLPHPANHRPSIPLRQDSPFRYDPPGFRQDSLIPLHRQNSVAPSLHRRPSSSTLGTTHLLNPDPRPPGRHRSTKPNRHSTIPEPEPPKRQGTPGQGEALREDAPPVPTRFDNPTSSPMMPLSPIRPLSPILRPSDTDPNNEVAPLRPSTLRSSISSAKPDLMRPETLRPDTFRAGYMRSDTPDPNDGILARRSGVSGVMRSGSGKSKGSRKEVRWSKDVDYEAGWR